VSVIFISAAWLAGISLGFIFAPPLALSLVSLIPLSFLFVFRDWLKPLILTSLCLLAFFGGIYCSHSSLLAKDDSNLSSYTGQEVEIQGTVSTSPEVRDKVTHVRITGLEISRDSTRRELSGDILLFVPRETTYAYGDVLLVKGALETPPSFDDFDYPGYLARQGIMATIYLPDITVLETGAGILPLTLVYSLREKLSRSLAQALPEPQAALTQGILLGIRYNIPSDILDDFTLTGTTHVLAVSGVNISIVAGMLLGIGLWLFGKKHYLYIWLALGIVWLYSILTGMQPPVVRAAIMASLFFIAELLGRQRSAVSWLALAAAVMTGLNPGLLGDPSFQMTCLSMLGLLFLYPPLMILGKKVVSSVLGERGFVTTTAVMITDSFAVTLAATAAVWPLIALYYGVVSFIGPLTTLLVLPALPVITMTGALTAIAGLIAPALAQVFAWSNWLAASYMLLIVSSLAVVPLAAISVSPPGPFGLSAYYIILSLTVFLISIPVKISRVLQIIKLKFRRSTVYLAGTIANIPAKLVIIPLLLLAILTMILAVTMPDSDLRVSFLDVGQGDAALVQYGNQQVLIDGGPSPTSLLAALGSRMPFWDREIEMVILTHPHADHLNGLLEVLERYHIGQVIYPEFKGSLTLNDAWLSRLEERHIPHLVARNGMEINLGNGALLDILGTAAPQVDCTETDIDNSSLILRLSLGEVSFLFTGDIREETEAELVQERAALSSTVLKVAHHGSRFTTSDAFLAVVDPLAAVISVGENDYGHPSDQVTERLNTRLGSENVYRTDRQGTIDFITDGRRLWINTASGYKA
jgi:competence protein ComEC